jgi:hypothetical protein
MSLMGTVLVAGLLLGPADEQKAAPTAEQIARAIEELGDDRLSVRQKATQFLWEAGAAAEPALKTALKSSDLEVVSRARVLLDRLTYGLRPGMSRELLDLVDQYRFGKRDDKFDALQILRDRGEIGLLLKAINAEPDAALRREAANRILTDTERVIPRLLAEGNDAQAEQLLELGLKMDHGPQDYAVYLLLRGKADAKLAELRGPDAPADAKNDRLAATILRAQGDLDAAWSIAEKTKDRSLQMGILFEQKRWSNLAKLYDKPSAKPDENDAEESIEDLGFLAAYHRLAGNKEAFAKDVARIVEHAKGKPTDAWFCGEALLLLDEPAQAIEMLKGRKDFIAFELLAKQHRYREAFELVGIDSKHRPTAEWLKEFEFQSKEDQDWTNGKGYLALKMAPALHRLGKTEEARALLDVADKAVEGDDLQAQSQLFKATNDVGPEERTLDLGAKQLARLDPNAVFGHLLRAHPTAAAAWWKLLCERHPDEARPATLKRVYQMFVAPPRGVPAEEFNDLADAAELAATKLEPDPRSKLLAAVAETYDARGEKKFARSFYEKSVEARPSTAACLEIADSWAEEKAWTKAAEWYRRAWDLDAAQVVALFMHGHALLQADPMSAEGKKWTELARLLPLGSARKRHTLAEGLLKRGLRDEALRQWELVLKTGPLEEWAVGDAAQKLGNALSGHDDLRAAAYWEQSSLRVLQTGTAIIETDGYLLLPHLIHKVRARGLLKAGKADEAVAEIKLAQAALPGEIELAIELVPELEKAKLKDAADELFAKAYELNAAICRDYPESGFYHNTVAWLAAKCQRRLDDALTHAKRAVELAPKTAAYIDTLGEVHFQRGEKDEAIACAKRCLEISPDDKFFKQQLARFEGKKEKEAE